MREGKIHNSSKTFFQYFVLAILTLTISGFTIQNRLELVDTTTVFSFPLGFLDGRDYAPRINYDGGALIENTDYDVQNPDLSDDSICFGVARSLLRHAGEDLYLTNAQTTNGAEITAVADGVVIEYNPAFDYPGDAIVIESPFCLHAHQ